MDSYTITIASNDDNGATTTLVVDTSGGNTRITDVHLRAAQGLSSNQIPNIDLGLLLQAVTAIAPDPALTGASTGQQPTPVVEATASSTDEAAALSTVGAPAAADDEPLAADEPAAVDDEPAAPAVPVAPRSRRRRSTPETAGSVAVERPASGRRGRKATRGAAAKAAAASAQNGSEAAPDSGGRIYRRAPADLSAVYAELGSASAVAQHYQVPRHTVQGWLRRLRNAS